MSSILNYSRNRRMEQQLMQEQQETAVKTAAAAATTMISAAAAKTLATEDGDHEPCLIEEEPQAITTTIVADTPCLRPLLCQAQKYAWGRRGNRSSVARMMAAQVKQHNMTSSYDTSCSFLLDENETYAELWLGTHPSGMSTISLLEQQPPSSSSTLLDYVRNNPLLHCGREDMTDLTFLFKVLSIEKVLSIQAHPDKTLAQRLHAERPHIYKDPNHKPEMAISLSPQTKLMCGFRSISEIAEHLLDYPELATVVGQEATQAVLQFVHDASTASSSPRSLLQALFRSYLECSPDLMQEQLAHVVNRLQQNNNNNNDDYLQRLMLTLHRQFPGDAGLFAPLLLNVMTIPQNQAIFIGPNEPHAYIEGELLECMACSDNVVRAGLTSKLKDVPTLVDMLTYETQRPQVLGGVEVDACTRRYQPPVEDFCVEVIDVEPHASYPVPPVASPSVWLVLEGTAGLQPMSDDGMDVSFGSAVFGSAGTNVTIEAGEERVRVARAFSNVYHENADNMM